MKIRMPIHIALCTFIAFAATLLLYRESEIALAYEEALTYAETSFTTEGTLPATCSETDLGSLFADGARQICGTELAIIPGGMISGTIEAGSVFESDLDRIIPDDAKLFTAYITPAELAAILETGVSYITTNEAEQIDIELSAWYGYPQVSGFSWEYDASAISGERIKYIWIDGASLDLSDNTTLYTLVSIESLCDGSLGFDIYTAHETDHTLKSALIAYFSSMESLSKPDSRTTVIGTSNYPIIGHIPTVAIIAACAIIALISAIPRLKQEKYFSFKPGLRRKKQL